LPAPARPLDVLRGARRPGGGRGRLRGREPRPHLHFVWYDASCDAGARYLYEGGEVEEAEELSYRAGYFYTYGEDDPNHAEWDDEEDEDEELAA